MLRWTGFAELLFDDSARLAFARAAELADTDAHEQHPGAWVVDDQRVIFSIETESPPAVLEGMKRFLSLLALQATSGEAVIEITAASASMGGVAGLPERWARRASSPSISKELQLEDLDQNGPQSQTIRVMAAG